MKLIILPNILQIHVSLGYVYSSREDHSVQTTRLFQDSSNLNFAIDEGKSIDASRLENIVRTRV